MRKSRLLFSLLLLALAFSTSVAWAKSYQFTLYKAASLSGQKLEPGNYKLELGDSGKATILRNGKSVVEANVEVQPLPRGKSTNTVVLAEDGSIREIRVGNKAVIFSR